MEPLKRADGPKSDPIFLEQGSTRDKAAFVKKLGKTDKTGPVSVYSQPSLNLETFLWKSLLQQLKICSDSGKF